MRDHRTILKQLFETKKMTLPAIAAHMGWKSPRTVAWKLDGDLDWKSGELEKMCETAGVTIVQLSEMADDLILTRHTEAITGARIIDGMSLAKREAAIRYLKSIEEHTSD